VPNTGPLRSTIIDAPQFQKLLCHFIPHLQIQFENNVPIFNLLFKKGDRKDKQVMDFEEFIVIFEILWRGTILEQFTLFFELLHTTDDRLTKAQFRTLLDVLYRMTYSGNTLWEQNSLRLEMFVDIVYESLKGHQDTLCYTDFEEMILKNDLLLNNFWEGM